MDYGEDEVTIMTERELIIGVVLYVMGLALGYVYGNGRRGR